MRVGLVGDVHWMVEPPLRSAGWHGAGAEFRRVLERLRQALQIFIDEHVDVIALTGDLSHHGDEESMIEVLESCAGVGVPVLVVAGNHDVAGDPGRLERARRRADVSGVALTGVQGEVHEGVRIAGVHVGETDGWFGARLNALPMTEEWGDEPVLLISHYPALSLAADVSGHGFPYPGDLLDRQVLADRLLGRDGPTVVLGGHVHARASRAEGLVLQLTSAALAEAPYECAIVEVVPGHDRTLTVSRCCRRLSPTAGKREAVFAPERERWHYAPAQGWSRAVWRLEESFVS